ncbi:hypothetical protein DPMN_110650 [Dreissena polymorpha]|uniref:Uncharacterized protein n=1 Tax=Dreissena polymorpha TaxID=45954 RepID=A0A9D4KDD5_DREPO|nr:hypothetical protein DPMN_110650 [Dreissena polymorpha]
MTGKKDGVVAMLHQHSSALVGDALCGPPHCTSNIPVSQGSTLIEVLFQNH